MANWSETSGIWCNKLCYLLFLAQYEQCNRKIIYLAETEKWVNKMSAALICSPYDCPIHDDWEIWLVSVEVTIHERKMIQTFVSPNMKWVSPLHVHVDIRLSFLNANTPFTFLEQRSNLTSLISFYLRHKF